MNRRQMLSGSLATAGLTMAPLRFQGSPSVLAQPRQHRQIARRVHGLRKLARHLGIPPHDVAKAMRTSEQPFQPVRLPSERSFDHSILDLNAAVLGYEDIRRLYTGLAGRPPTPDEHARALKFLLDTSPPPTSRRAWLPRFGPSRAYAEDYDDSGIDYSQLTTTLINTVEVGAVYLNPMDSYWADKPFFGQLYDFGRSIARVFGFNNGPWISGGARDAMQAEYDRQWLQWQAYEEWERNGRWLADPVDAFYGSREAAMILNVLNQAQYFPSHSVLEYSWEALSVFHHLGAAAGLIGAGVVGFQYGALPAWKMLAPAIAAGEVAFVVTTVFGITHITIIGLAAVLVGLYLVEITLDPNQQLVNYFLPKSGVGSTGLIGGDVIVNAPPYVPLNPGAQNIQQDWEISRALFLQAPYYWADWNKPAFCDVDGYCLPWYYPYGLCCGGMSGG